MKRNMKRIIWASVVAWSLALGAIVTTPQTNDLLCSLCSIYTPDDALYWLYGCFVCPPAGSETAAKVR